MAHAYSIFSDRHCLVFTLVSMHFPAFAYSRCLSLARPLNMDLAAFETTPYFMLAVDFPALVIIACREFRHECRVSRSLLLLSSPFSPRRFTLLLSSFVSLNSVPQIHSSGRHLYCRTLINRCMVYFRVWWGLTRLAGTNGPPSCCPLLLLVCLLGSLLGVT